VLNNGRYYCLPFARKLLLGLALFGLLGSCQSDPQEATDAATNSTEESVSLPRPERIVSLNGTMTELLFQLGYGAQIVGVDITSTYPGEELGGIPRLGHISQLNVEALLELAPELVVVSAADADKPGLTKLREAGIEVAPIELTNTLDNALNAAEALGTVLPVSEQQLSTLKQQMQGDQETLAGTLAGVGQTAKPKVLFIHARGPGRLLVAGYDTGAARMIEYAGGENAITTFADFEALTPESLVAAAPDAILMFTSGLASLDGTSGLGQIPGIKQTPAFQNNKVIAMDGHYLLSFGPRAAQAANDLARSLAKKEAR